MAKKPTREPVTRKQLARMIAIDLFTMHGGKYGGLTASRLALIDIEGRDQGGYGLIPAMNAIEKVLESVKISDLTSRK